MFSRNSLALTFLIDVSGKLTQIYSPVNYICPLIKSSKRNENLVYATRSKASSVRPYKMQGLKWSNLRIETVRIKLFFVENIHSTDYQPV